MFLRGLGGLNNCMIKSGQTYEEIYNLMHVYNVYDLIPHPHSISVDVFPSVKTNAFAENYNVADIQLLCIYIQTSKCIMLHLRCI